MGLCPSSKNGGEVRPESRRAGDHFAQPGANMSMDSSPLIKAILCKSFWLVCVLGVFQSESMLAQNRPDSGPPSAGQQQGSQPQPGQQPGAQPQAQPPQASPAQSRQTMRPLPLPGQTRPAEGPRNFDEAELSLEGFYWNITGQRPHLQGGRKVTVTTSTFGNTTTTTTVTDYASNLNLPGKIQRAPGGSLTIPAGRYNALRFSYFQTKGEGTTTADSSLGLFGTVYDKGDFLDARYVIRNARITYDYFSGPYPARANGLHLRELWEIQWTTMKTMIDAPNKSATATSAGQVISPTASGNRSVVLPTFGLELVENVNKNFRLMANASGFGIPHHGNIWDAEAWAAYRIGKVEIKGGFKAYHFKTSAQQVQSIGGTTLSGAFVDIRIYPKWW